MDTNRYDVFISCKNEDYKYAKEVYDFLTKNHFNTFLSSKELRKLGDYQKMPEHEIPLFPLKK